MDPNVSAQLQVWDDLAGYSLTTGCGAHDGRPLFWSAGGETRIYVGVNEEGWFVVTESDRFGPEFFTLAAPSMATIEKYFFGRFGRLIRSRRGLCRIHIPINREDIPPEYSINTLVFDGVTRQALTDSHSSLVAIASGDELTGTAELAKLSLYLNATIDDIMASFLDPDGKPLFTPK